MSKVNLALTIGGLKLKTPVICASGTFGYGEELVGLVDFKDIGAITTKTITLNRRAGNPPPRIYETDAGVINSVGLENPGLSAFINKKFPRLRKLPVPVIVSIGGFSLAEYEKITNRLDKISQIRAIELNLSCPNIRMKKLISQSEKLTRHLVATVRRLTRKTLIVKITPEVTNIVDIAQAAAAGGADCISLVNTFFAMAINIETMAPVIGAGFGGYSGKAIKPLALYRVWQVAANVDIPIIGGGGISCAGDAIEFLLAGADAVSVGTQNLVSPNCSRAIVRGIRDYMKRKKISDIKKLTGRLRL